MIDLENGEHLVWEGRPGWSWVTGRLLFPALLFLLGVWFAFGGVKGETVSFFILIIAIGYLFYVLSKLEPERYMLTNRRAIALVDKRVSQIKLADLQDVLVIQSIFERIGDVGSLKLTAAGGSPASVTFHALSHPERVRSMVVPG